MILSLSSFIFPLTEPTGSARFGIPPGLPGPYLVHAELVQAQDGQSALTLDTVDQLVEETGLTELPPEGGQAEGLDGRVKLTVPPGAAPDGMSVRIHPPLPSFYSGQVPRQVGTGTSTTPPDSLSGNPFEIVAADEKTGAELHEFKEPLLIEIPFKGGRDRSIFYYDPTAAEWFALPTEVDRENGVLRAATSHLTVFDDDLNEWQMAEMPTLDAAQVSGQTGSASYSVPIWTPPGPEVFHLRYRYLIPAPWSTALLAPSPRAVSRHGLELERRLHRARHARHKGCAYRRLIQPGDERGGWDAAIGVGRQVPFIRPQLLPHRKKREPQHLDNLGQGRQQIHLRPGREQPPALPRYGASPMPAPTPNTPGNGDCRKSRTNSARS